MSIIEKALEKLDTAEPPKPAGQDGAEPEEVRADPVLDVVTGQAEPELKPLPELAEDAAVVQPEEVPADFGPAIERIPEAEGATEDKTAPEGVAAAEPKWIEPSPVAAETDRPQHRQHEATEPEQPLVAPVAHQHGLGEGQYGAAGQGPATIAPIGPVKVLLPSETPSRNRVIVVLLVDVEWLA